MSNKTTGLALLGNGIYSHATTPSHLLSLLNFTDITGSMTSKSSSSFFTSGLAAYCQPLQPVMPSTGTTANVPAARGYQSIEPRKPIYQISPLNVHVSKSPSPASSYATEVSSSSTPPSPHPGSISSWSVTDYRWLQLHGNPAHRHVPQQFCHCYRS